MPSIDSSKTTADSFSILLLTLESNFESLTSPIRVLYCHDPLFSRRLNEGTTFQKMKSLLILALCVAAVIAGCPSFLHDCAGACYTDDLYCCVNGVLTQKQFCGNDNNNNNNGNNNNGNNNNNNDNFCPYGNQQLWSGWNLVDQFNFFTGGDPTHGFVQFVDRATAQNTGLISADNGNGHVYMGVDHNNVAPNGRPAVRWESKEYFGNGMLILDLAHMPGSVCGTWPAFWTVGDNWPNNGEIDIIEGVNRGDTNQMTLHTNGGCSMGGQWQSGRTIQGNCDVAATGNAGCGVMSTKPNTYGDNFNNNGGGVYAMERTDNTIRVWIFPRNAIPADVLSGSPNPCSWGQPDADFELGGACPNNHFQGHKIVFDITFCGDWAGAVFNQQCGGDCVSYVRDNPSAFSESYWLINSLRWAYDYSAEIWWWTKMQRRTVVPDARKERGKSVGSTVRFLCPPHKVTPPQDVFNSDKNIRREPLFLKEGEEERLRVDRFREITLIGKCQKPPRSCLSVPPASCSDSQRHRQCPKLELD
ncbi:putative endo-1,3(4)-beta-glucanase [Planoprotostelium fungivorum]|uniref:endo-1,3(4)-beta-glucanase n=1 Tax=Planoprotostelium fungivorum TaxID=1890364 RepID=A0A2P6N974_9EUKA|nr:putative endo-1,3(4)-beta-glucanase [Planoprotostelium fungivorum]